MSLALALNPLPVSVLYLTLTFHHISFKSSQLSAVQKYYHIYKENGSNNDYRKKYRTSAEFKHSGMVTA